MPDHISAYRIVAPKWEQDAFSGEGAKKFGGRWNSPGKQMIYLAGSRALAALEMLVHLTTPLARKKRYRIIEVQVPSIHIAKYPSNILPQSWRDEPPTAVTMSIGDDWIDAQSHAALRVPSTIIPEESNYLINPTHPDIKKISIGEAVDFFFDPRLYNSS